MIPNLFEDQIFRDREALLDAEYEFLYGEEEEQDKWITQEER